jgi:uncharacterized SAM-binding protein YcdF (DUF218 family)
MTDCEKFIAIVDNDILEKSDAIVLLEGDGLNRYQKAVELYNSKFANKIIFSGGITDYEYGSFPFSDVLPHILKTGVPSCDIIHEDKSLNTREQAIEVMKISIQNGWKKLILVATHEHQYRAYLTFLREVIETGSKIIVYNCPARNLGWFAESGWGMRFDNLEKEFERIELYSKMNHLATYKQAIEYQKWKETKNLLK